MRAELILDAADWHYPGIHGTTSQRRLRVWREGPGRLVAIITERPQDAGTSITNAAEAIAARLAQQYPDDVVDVVEHYTGAGPGTLFPEHYDIVSINPNRLPVWQRIPREDLENRLGTSLTTPVLALSVRRPWANLLMAGIKPVENRVWSTDYRGDLCLHAGQAWDRAGGAFATRLGVEGFDDPDACPTGYLGMVRLDDVHPTGGCCGPWAEQEPGIYHWRPTDLRPFPEPVPGPGRLRIYRVPAGVLPEEWVLAAGDRHP